MLTLLRVSLPLTITSLVAFNGCTSASDAGDQPTLPSCPANWEPRAETGRCYLASPTFDFDTAVWLCQENGGELLAPQSALELELAATTLCREFKSTCWLAATDRTEEGSWAWLDGSPMSAPDPIAWGPGQPDDADQAADEDCLAINEETLVDRDCMKLSVALCVRDADGPSDAPAPIPTFCQQLCELPEVEQCFSAQCETDCAAVAAAPCEDQGRAFLDCVGASEDPCHTAPCAALLDVWTACSGRGGCVGPSCFELGPLFGCEESCFGIAGREVSCSYEKGSTTCTCSFRGEQLGTCGGPGGFNGCCAALFDAMD